MLIRKETDKDYHSILTLTYEAFKTLDFPNRGRIDEHFLVSLLRGTKHIEPELCFVCEIKGKIVGHILYTKSQVVKSDGTSIPTLTFGPLSVEPKFQRQGIGAALVRHSLEIAKNLGYGAVLIFGVPEYYPKLGFRRAKEFGVTLGDGTSPDAFMAIELQEGYLSNGGVFDLVAPEFEMAENDDINYWAFHKWFMSNFYDELTLRPLFENDIVLIERWLKVEHVKKWFEPTEDWLHEIKNRRGEFSFITHLIAEFKGVPFGFCQYYDMFYGQEKENWLKIDKESECFSIDYLIGEEEFLHKGLGQKMIALMLNKLRDKGAKTVVVRPEIKNKKSNRVLKNSGFIWNGTDYILSLR